MEHRPTPHRTEPSQALDIVLRSRGFESGDFELEEDRSSDLSHLLGIVGGVLKVRCCSTGEERIYSTGLSSAWLGAFVMDLGRGHFARAARRRDSAHLPVTQSPPRRLDA
jgi:hypothetical protein